MKKRADILIPLIFGFLLSGCSTSPQPSESTALSRSQQEAEIQEEQIAVLEQKIKENESQLLVLNQSIN